MAMISDWEAHDNNGYPAKCGRCNKPLGTFPTLQEAGQVELRHQLDKHRAALEAEADKALGEYGTDGKKPAKLTRDQKRNKFRKPGTR